MAGVVKVVKPPLSRKQFRTPIIIGVSEVPPALETSTATKLSVDEMQDRYLEDRKKRRLADAKNAELEVAVEADRRDAALIRKERERLENTETNPEEDSVSASQRAAEIAAEVAGAGGTVEEAKDMANQKKSVIVLGSRDKTSEEKKKTGYAVVNGQIVPDADSPMTLKEAIEVFGVMEKAKRGWTVIDFNAVPSENGMMTYEQAREQAAQLRKERDEEARRAAERAGDPKSNQLLERLVKNEEEARKAEIISYRERTDRLMEHITKGNGNQPAKFTVLTKEGGKLTFKQISADEPYIPPSLTDEPDKHETEMEKIEREKMEADKEHKEGIRKILGEAGKVVTTAVTDFTAAAVAEKMGTGRTPAPRPNTATITCINPKCKFTIPVPPVWDHVECPNPSCKTNISRVKCGNQACQKELLMQTGTASFTCPGCGWENKLKDTMASPPEVKKPEGEVK